MKVFIGYRRDDSIIHARLIHNELAARFRADQVSMDIEDIAYGVTSRAASTTRLPTPMSSWP